MAKRTPKPDRGIQRELAVTSVNYRKMQDALIELDKNVQQYEKKWGTDRLPELVPQELREAFLKQLDLLNNAIAQNVGSEVAREAETMLRAYKKMDQVAEANGYEPLTGECWEAPMPDGKVLLVCQTNEEACNVDTSHRDCVVFSMEEIACILSAWQEYRNVEMAKHVFPGATIETVTEKTKELPDDNIPF